MRAPKRRKPKCERLEQLTRPAWVHRYTDADLRGRLMGAELQLLRLIERDLPNKGIASYLGITDGEVSTRMADLHRKLGLTPSTGPTWLQRHEAQLAISRGEA
jgi:DNA-binding NarL/FixJ family response regulator